MDWNTLSDQALTETLGGFIKQNRLDQNRTQQEVADKAGISRSTLSLLERGETVTLNTFIRVLRVLDLLHIMDTFEVKPQLSPIELAKMQRDQRKRARKTTDNDEKPASEW
ncbi:MAG: helix-turn-helix transcriptional regulator [Fulvivirga sp.]